MENRSQHWNEIYQARDETDLTWFESPPTISHELVVAHSEPGDTVIEIGGGASRLVDRLVADGYEAITVLDVSAAALKVSKKRLGAFAAKVTWIVADITAWDPMRTYALWHDRAVFHFLTDPSERAAYVAVMDAALVPGGIAIIATFAEDGPQTCSGLPVARYSPAELAETIEELAPGRFRSIEARKHVHVTPKGNRQSFQVSAFKKTVQVRSGAFGVE